MGGKTATCKICGKEFKNAAGLAGHMTLVHEMKGGEKWKETKDKTGCKHLWRRLKPSELTMQDDQGRTVEDMGFLYECTICGTLR